ncbi:hemicentin-2-like isoform X1 [Bombus pyrosoma]|uniref:hemicentin-2-like isoform X1 n=1 Tax=Bombus pyrosoma TaxID=396416 RepID=UPI001CB8CC10|nr:hemicentin-2-like isoform X1 [Bombus pyrosoma]XP_043582643.1 hemicentin-2-like isoform X1 [Bombus pyrosoma]XP_043582644.1 hemicentin-2-like isoform X1 [Bombus pyrosoma]
MLLDEMAASVHTLLSFLLVLGACTLCRGRITNQEIVTMIDAEAVAGGTAQLPCDVEPPVPGDKLHLVIWYKEEADAPIYSFDTRTQSTLEQGKHWQDISLDKRAFFKYSEKPAKLILESVRESDAAVYRCRVDFKQSPTRNSKVNLTVIIPPEQLSILDESGRSHIPYYVLGPYSEGASLNITCVAAGGRPQPRVTWWQENALLDDTYETVGTKRVRNVLRLEKLGREHLGAILTCQASNNNMVTPISSSVTLNMNLKPLWVRMQGENRPFSAGTTYEIGCEIVGARPNPKITWSKGSLMLRNARQTMSPDSNVTTSILTFVPTIEDAGKFLSCHGSVPDIPDSEMEDGWKLDIHHEPVVMLELGSNLNLSAIREGIDVYFECNIKSNPWVYKVSWRHNGNPLYHNPATGTIISNQSLVLQSVTRSRAGIYTCIGSNQEGDGESNPLNLDIKFTPVCHHGQVKVFGVARQETTRIPCELEANPAEVTFTWKFNNTMEAIDIPQAHVTSERTRSTASYTPMTELDYGTLLCWGTNDQGTQLEPCVYHIVPAGHPDTPHNCSLLNQTTDSLYVECTEGFDGGLPQKFTIQVDREVGTSSTSSKPSTTVYNQTSKVPSFSVSNLEPGTTYDVHIYASNSKGRSETVHFRATTLNLPERRTAGERLAQPPPPENCTIREESRTTVRVSCAESEYIDPRTATYVLQVFDADTRRLLASATSMTPSMLEITDLPAERSYSGLVLSLRIMTEHAMSDATVLHSPHFVQEGKTQEHQRYPALTPVMLSLSGPLLGAVVGATAGLLLVIFVIVLAVRLRYRPRTQEDKDSHDDGGMANLAASGTGSSSPRDKSSTLPLNSDSIESFEKDPDIIPHANENSYAELCKGTSPRYVLHQQRTDASTFTNTSNGSELTYAELSLRNRRIPPNCYQPVQVSNIQRPQLLAMSTLTRRQPIQEPTIYAQVASHSKPIYVPPPHPYMSRTNDETTVETPLIGHDNKITTISQPGTSIWRTDTPPASSAPTT